MIKRVQDYFLYYNLRVLGRKFLDDTVTEQEKETFGRMITYEEKR